MFKRVKDGDNPMDQKTKSRWYGSDLFLLFRSNIRGLSYVLSLNACGFDKLPHPIPLDLTMSSPNAYKFDKLSHPISLYLTMC